MTVAVSIVVPVHGRAALTERCLDSLLAGLHGRCEVIVVDDASTDRTSELLRSYGERIRTLTLAENVGYARACNHGAVLASHETLVFLNNDTEPLAGWLEALGDHARSHPAAAVVGAKLLYPTGQVQHAGVVIGQDGYPHNLYAGLPAEHPAVNRSRALQAVTGACMLVRRRDFERAGGFDCGYVNSLEDVDLCLRIGAAGAEVRYCHEAVLTHLESASRGHEDRFEQSVALYRERWRDTVRRDDLSIYAEDGLLEVEYPEHYPVRLSVSPRLAVVDVGRQSDIEGLLEAYAGEVSELLAEVLRLSAIAGSPLALTARGGGLPERRAVPAAHHAFLADANRLEEEIRELQQRLEDAGRDSAQTPVQGPQPFTAQAPQAAFTAARRLGYGRLVERVRAAVAQTVPSGSAVLVISRGDRALVELEDRRAGHFPQDPSGAYLGHHPRDSKDAIERLEELRARGADYLVLPSTSYWWLEHYRDFAEHLRERYPVTDTGACSIYGLRRARAGRVREAGG
jgi:GT2 family glycosyltransferase